MIFGGGGVDILLGGEGDDTFFQSTGIEGDKIEGGLDRDHVVYTLLPYAISANLATGIVQKLGDTETENLYGIEDLTGSEFGDEITGNSQQNKLTGGKGADTVIGGGGDDILVATLGDSGFEGDTYDGGADTDVLSYNHASFTQGLHFMLDDGELDISLSSSFSGSVDTILNIEAIEGSSHDDNFYFQGDNSSVSIVLAGGDNSHYGDTADFSAYSDSIVITDNSLVHNINKVSGTSITLERFENFISGSGNDTINGNSASNIIS